VFIQFLSQFDFVKLLYTPDMNRFFVPLFLREISIYLRERMTPPRAGLFRANASFARYG